MYTYGRFWDSDKLMLLYPGKHYDGGYQLYRNEYDANREHQCKIGRVSVLDENNDLNENLGGEVLLLLEEEVLVQE